MKRVFVLQYKRQNLSGDAYVAESAGKAAKLLIQKEFTVKGERKPSDSQHGEDYDRFLEDYTQGYKPDRDHYPTVFSDILFHEDICYEFICWFYEVFLNEECDEDNTELISFWAWQEEG